MTGIESATNSSKDMVSGSKSTANYSTSLGAPLAWTVGAHQPKGHWILAILMMSARRRRRLWFARIKPCAGHRIHAYDVIQNGGLIGFYHVVQGDEGCIWDTQPWCTQPAKIVMCDTDSFGSGFVEWWVEVIFFVVRSSGAACG